MPTSMPLSDGFVVKVVITAIVILILSLLSYLAKRLIRNWQADVKARYWTNNVISYIAFFIGLVIVGSIWLEGFKSLSTYLGLLSAGLAIALKDPLVDIAGWIFILIRRPFVLGDRIQIGENAGDVVDQRIFQFTINEIGNWVDADQSTGRIIHIPNSLIFTTPISNFNKGFSYIWNEIAVLVTFESDWKKAKKLLQSLADKQFEQTSQNAANTLKSSANKYMIVYNKLTPRVYTNVKDSGIMLTIRHVCLPHTRRIETEKMWESILIALENEAKIDLAYPTIRYFDNGKEGKVR